MLIIGLQIKVIILLFIYYCIKLYIFPNFHLKHNQFIDFGAAIDLVSYKW